MPIEIVNALFLLIIFIFLSFLLGSFWSQILTGRKYRLFLAPGIIVHEISHALICFLTGAKIKEINFFSSKGGYVTHGPSQIPIFGQLAIGFAPFLGGISVLLISAWLFGFSFVPEIGSFGDFLRQAFYFISQSWPDWQLFLFIYLATSIVICLIPSWEDLKNSFSGVFILIILGLALYYFGWLPKFLEMIFNQYLWSVLSLGIFFEIRALNRSFSA